MSYDGTVRALRGLFLDASRDGDDKSVGWPAWAQVVERGSEGYSVKDEVSAYEGGPTRRWLKIKQKGWTVEEDRWRRRISESPPTR